MITCIIIIIIRNTHPSRSVHHRYTHTQSSSSNNEKFDDSMMKTEKKIIYIFSFASICVVILLDAVAWIECTMASGSWYEVWGMSDSR